MEVFLLSTSVVAIAEIGDKTQLLALVLATRYRRPVPLILGILVATAANHALAALLGTTIADWLAGDILKWTVGATFLAMGVWALQADELDCGAGSAGKGHGAFVAAAFAFFIVEMGDKTQLATATLAAHLQSAALVAAGTTLGMLVANVPVVLLGEVASTRLPLPAIRVVAALVFIGLGLAALADAAGAFG